MGTNLYSTRGFGSGTTSGCVRVYAMREIGFECKPVVSFLQKNLSQGNKKLLQDKLKNSLTHNNISVTPHGVLNRIVLKTYITDSQTANTGAVGKRASRECIGKVLHAGSSAGVVIRIG